MFMLPFAFCLGIPFISFMLVSEKFTKFLEMMKIVSQVPCIVNITDGSQNESLLADQHGILQYCMVCILHGAVRYLSGIWYTLGNALQSICGHCSLPTLVYVCY